MGACTCRHGESWEERYVLLNAFDLLFCVTVNKLGLGEGE